MVPGTPTAQPAEVSADPPAAPAAPAAPEAAPDAQPAVAADVAAPAAASAASAAEQPSAEAAIKVEEKPALDATDAALDQKMAQEDKPRLIQVSWEIYSPPCKHCCVLLICLLPPPCPFTCISGRGNRWWDVIRMLPLMKDLLAMHLVLQTMV